VKAIDFEVFVWVLGFLVFVRCLSACLCAATSPASTAIAVVSAGAIGFAVWQLRQFGRCNRFCGTVIAAFAAGAIGFAVFLGFFLLPFGLPCAAAGQSIAACSVDKTSRVVAAFMVISGDTSFAAIRSIAAVHHLRQFGE
jgi:hypothetical protein